MASSASRQCSNERSRRAALAPDEDAVGARADQQLDPGTVGRVVQVEVVQCQPAPGELADPRTALISTRP